MRRDHTFRSAFRHIITALILLMIGSCLWAEESRLRMDVQGGVAFDTIKIEDTESFFAHQYPLIRWNYGFGAGYRINDYLELYSFPHPKTRYIESKTSNGRLTTRARYIDVPMILRTRINNYELGAGPSLAIETGTENEIDRLYENIKDSPSLIPGYTLSATYRPRKYPRLFAHFYYRWDMLHFSESGSYKKTQESGSLNLGYTFYGGNPLKDLFPVSSADLNEDSRGVQIGVQHVRFGDADGVMPHVRIEKYSEAGNGWSLTKSTALGMAVFVEGKGDLLLFRSTFENQLGYRYGFLEPYLAPGIGIAILHSKEHRSIDSSEDNFSFGNFTIALPIFSAEAGCRF
ncbi:MAG: hypothetical protein U1C33_06890, partial [Candidatus Cloacimonadaceae bacterium]|nr:hypothetical protein [Candidatus Cloacimonadaceae bacterium]